MSTFNAKPSAVTVVGPGGFFFYGTPLKDPKLVTNGVKIGTFVLSQISRRHPFALKTHTATGTWTRLIQHAVEPLLELLHPPLHLRLHPIHGPVQKKNLRGSERRMLMVTGPLCSVLGTHHHDLKT